MIKKLEMDELGRLSNDQFKAANKIPVIVVLDDIRSLNNIGSVFRTADAFRLEAIYLCGITAQPPHRDIHKTALGTTDSVDWKYFEKIEDAILQLKEVGVRVVGIEQTTSSIALDEYAIVKEEKYALIFGNEVNGIKEDALEMLDDCIEIPQWGTKHSLNISVCAGVVLWEFAKQFKENLT